MMTLSINRYAMRSDAGRFISTENSQRYGSFRGDITVPVFSKTIDFEVAKSVLFATKRGNYWVHETRALFRMEEPGQRRGKPAYLTVKVVGLTHEQILEAVAIVKIQIASNAADSSDPERFLRRSRFYQRALKVEGLLRSEAEVDRSESPVSSVTAESE